ncbi:RNA polymerase sigma factor [Microbacterium binotii]|uniref:RNA polymerase sigma factor n=1 Tax=Microbacterium binotii TaxID=462710 RepID=UPI001F2A1F5D|nr:RNA polymerase sigma factor [Microbacterium binotii]UIN30690.1 RNA polymerase sigma factor [Microbacterium binotii]
MSAHPNSADRERVAQHFKDHAPELVRYARRLGATQETAEDAVAESFATVLTFDADRLVQIDNLRAYLYSMTRTALRKIQLHEARVLPTPAEALDRPAEDFSVSVSIHTSVQIAERAIGQLDERQRALLRHVVIGARPAAEVATELGMTPTGVTTAVQRVRSAFRYAYATEYLSSTPPECGFDTAVIARVVTGRAGLRDGRRYRLHSAECEFCPQLERSLLEELDAGSLIPVLALALPLSGVFTLAPPSSARAESRMDAPRGRSSTAITTIGVAAAVIAVSAALAALLSLPATDDSRDPDVAVPAVPLDTARIDIDAEPGSIALDMPAPGEQREWSAAVTNRSSQPVTIIARLDGEVSHNDETPALSLGRDGTLALSSVTADDLPAAVSLGQLAPGTTAQLTGTVVRAAGDVRQDLAGTVSVRLWASAGSADAPALGSAVEGVIPVDSLAATGGPPSWGWVFTAVASLALGAAALAFSRRTAAKRRR